MLWQQTADEGVLTLRGTGCWLLNWKSWWRSGLSLCVPLSVRMCLFLKKMTGFDAVLCCDSTPDISWMKFGAYRIFTWSHRVRVATLGLHSSVIACNKKSVRNRFQKIWNISWCCAFLSKWKYELFISLRIVYVGNNRFNTYLIESLLRMFMFMNCFCLFVTVLEAKRIFLTD